MAFFDRIKKVFSSEPKEQVLGYSPAELKEIYQNPNATVNPVFSKNYPAKHSLAHVGINAFYFAQLIDKRDLEVFLNRVNADFKSVANRQFNGSEVVQCKSKTDETKLLYLNADEFGGSVIKIVTDSVFFLNSIADCNFHVPPPWIAFDGYNPAWWLGNLQGAQGYYDSNFFSDFFRAMSVEQREEYYVKYQASPEWRSRLDLNYGDED
ncbi:MAG: hypothetical protein ACXU8A_09365 [Burkholderiaceae bacterium]